VIKLSLLVSEVNTGHSTERDWELRLPLLPPQGFLDPIFEYRLDTSYSNRNNSSNVVIGKNNSSYSRSSFIYGFCSSNYYYIWVDAGKKLLVYVYVRTITITITTPSERNILFSHIIIMKKQDISLGRSSTSTIRYCTHYRRPIADKS
jgi:hypothetical protein